MVKKTHYRNVSIIGAGRVGTTIGYLLSRRGCPFSGIFSRSHKSAETAIKFIKRGKIFPTIQNLLQSSNTILITVADAEIKNVVKEIVKRKNLNGKIFIHTSGLFSSSILSPISSHGGYVATMHPLLAIPSPKIGIALVKGSYFALEGRNKARSEAEKLVQMMGALSFKINSNIKSQYHLAACFLSNYIVSLSDMAMDLLPEKLITRNEWLKIFSPLIAATAQGLSREGIPDALTGPVSRGDLSTIRKHISILKKLPKEFQSLHIILARRALKIALQQRELGNGERKELIKLLGKETS